MAVGNRGSAEISAQGLTKVFGDIQAVDHISFQVEKGKIFGFLGHNGAGKTTTVRLLNGLLTPSGGSCQVGGLSPVTQGTDLRSITGVLPETPSLDERLTGRENLTFFAHLYQAAEDRVSQRREELLEQFGLDERADDFVKAYSKGMKQRLALARTLIHEPEIIFLDEPTAGLDPLAARQVQELILKLSKEGRTIFLCTHNLQEAQRLCHRVAVLYQGRVIVEGAPEALSDEFATQTVLEIEVGKSDDPAMKTYLEDRDMPYIALDQGHLFRLSDVERCSIPDLIESVIDEGIHIYRVDPREETLEDIYFALHEMLEDRA